jgi:Metallo-beta-lactamase superfamily
MAARDPWRSGRKRPRHPITRACRDQHWGRCDPPRHLASTWKRPVAAHLTTLNQAAAHQCLCHRAPRRHRAVRHRPRRYAHRPAGGHRHDLADVRTAVLSHLHQNHIGGLPELERRPGHGSRARRLRDPAPTGVPVAAGRTACATTGEREAPPRSRLARTRRPRVAAARRPGRRHRPRARGPRRARPSAAASRSPGAPRGCASPGRCSF